MSDINVYTFSGRLGNDAELKYTQAGTAVWNASVGVGYGYGDKKGTNWIRVSVFGKRAESLGGLDLKKGAAIGVTGELRVRVYDKDNGSKGTSVEVNAQDVALLGSKPAAPREEPQRNAERQAPADEPFPDDDIPF